MAQNFTQILMMITNLSGGSGVTPVIKNLIIINVLMYFGSTLIPYMAPYLNLYHWKSPLFQPWQLVTHIFMHADFTHLLFNMLMLWMIGGAVEARLGSKRFLNYYLICGFGAALLHMLVFSWENQTMIHAFSQLSDLEQQKSAYSLYNAIATQDFDHISMQDAQYWELAQPMVTSMLGASGAVYGVMFAFGYLFPNLMVNVFLIFPIKAKYLVALMAIGEFFAGLKNNPMDNVAHFAHIGGMLFGYLMFKIWKIHYDQYNRWY